MPIYEKPLAYIRTAFPTFHTTPESPFIWEPSKLHVVTPVINARRFSSRYHLFERFEKMVQDAGATLWVVEAAFGNRPHIVTRSDNPQHIQLRTHHELWHKENMINIGISRLPADWEYVAYCDSDIDFARPDWVNETLNQLQHYSIVQMFSDAHDLAPDFTILNSHPGIIKRYMAGELPISTDIELTGYYGTTKTTIKHPVKYAHPGYAWAARRKAIDDLGGLIDYCIIGSADWHMAYALMGQMEQTINVKWSKSFIALMLEWQARAERHIRRNIGFVPGAIFHHWHGNKSKRRYTARANFLINNNYDPHLDLKRDSQGMWQLTDRSIKLRDDLRRYMSSRDEDSSTVE